MENFIRFIDLVYCICIKWKLNTWNIIFFSKYVFNLCLLSYKSNYLPSSQKRIYHWKILNNHNILSILTPSMEINECRFWNLHFKLKDRSFMCEISSCLNITILCSFKICGIINKLVQYGFVSKGFNYKPLFQFSTCQTWYIWAWWTKI